MTFASEHSNQCTCTDASGLAWPNASVKETGAPQSEALFGGTSLG